MFGTAIQKALIAWGLKAVRTPKRIPLPVEDDFVARYGLSYGDLSDPVSDEARVEAERQKNFRRSGRR